MRIFGTFVLVVVALLDPGVAHGARAPRDLRTVWLVGPPDATGTVRLDLDSITERADGRLLRTEISLSKRLGDGVSTGYVLRHRRRLDRRGASAYVGSLASRLTRIRLRARWVGEELRVLDLRIRWKGTPDAERLVGRFGLADVTATSVLPRE